MSVLIDRKALLPRIQTAALLFIAAWTVLYIVLNLCIGKSIGLSAAYFIILGLMVYSVDSTSWLTIALVLMFFIPSEANILFTGISYAYPSGQINLHVLSYYILGGFLSFVYRGYISRKVRIHTSIREQAAIFGIALLIEVVIEALRLRGSGFSNYVFDIFLCPVLMYRVAVESLHQPEIKRVIMKTFYAFTFIAALYAILEFALFTNLIFDPLFEAQDLAWYYSIRQSVEIGEPYRVTSIFGHPLTNAAFFLAGFLMMAAELIKQTKKRIGLAVVTCFTGVGLILTFSRFAFVLAVIMILWMYVHHRQRSALNTLKLIAIGIAFMVAVLPLATGIFQRDTEGASLMLRMITLKGLIENGLSVISFLGYGPQNMEDTITLLTGFNTGFNLEIGYVIVLLQYGVLFTALYLYGILRPIINYIKMRPVYLKSACYPYAIAAIALFLYFAGSNTIGIRGTINYLFFLILALLTTSMISDEVGNLAA